MNWFGKLPTVGPDLEIPVPVGKTCTHCQEAIGPNDSGVKYCEHEFAHRNCHLRQVLGSVAHIERRCGCYVKGSEEDDPPGLTRRQAADAAVAAWEAQKRMRVN
jgi:hypothetical protein